jgi:hypothetical protein
MTLEGSMEEQVRLDHILCGALRDRGAEEVVNYTHEIFLAKVSLLTLYFFYSYFLILFNTMERYDKIKWKRKSLSLSRERE